MKILLAAFGTRGDVQPMVALGIRLRAEGHAVTIGASPGFAAWVRGHDLNFHAVGCDIESWTRAHPDMVHHPVRALLPVIHYLREDLELALDHTIEAARGSDLILSGIHAASSSVAELLGVPHRTIVLCPQMIRSRHQPPPGLPWFSLPKQVQSCLWTAFAHGLNAMLRERLNRRRCEWGLAPIESMLDHLCPPDAILASDALLGVPPVDAPRTIVQTGSLALNEGDVLEPALERFLDQGEPPIYLGFGSMPDGDARRTTHEMLAALAASGRRGIILSGWAGLGEVADSRDVLVIRTAPHALLLPRVAIAVHHGGAGTTAAAARAGIPQIVVPHLADQYYWGDRTYRLGVGSRPIPRQAMNAHRLEQAIETIAARPAIAERARALAVGLATTDGMGAMVRHLASIRLRSLEPRAAA